MILTYTPAELYGMLSGNTNCLSSITYDSSYLYFDTLGSNKYGFFANIPVVKNFILEYDLVCVGSIYPSFNPTFGSNSITTTDAQYYGFMVAFYAKLEVWRGRNLSNNPSNSRIANAISSTDYSNAVVVDTSIHVKIQRDTSTITVYLDGTLYQTVTSNDAQASNAGYFGFFNWSGTSCKIGNFKITSDEIGGGSGVLKYLNFTGLSNLVTNIKNWVTARIPTKTSEITNDSGFITSSSLPTVNNATLTIQKNGTNVQTFTANASSNKTANITVPTKVSELTNDNSYIPFLTPPSLMGFDWSTQYPGKVGIKIDATWLGGILTTANTTIPTKTSDLTNDSGFLTSSTLSTNFVTTDTTQTVTGAKTFSSNGTIIKLRATNHTKGVIPSGDLFNYINFEDANGVQTGFIAKRKTNGYSCIHINSSDLYKNQAMASDGTNVSANFIIGTSTKGVPYWQAQMGSWESIYPHAERTTITLGTSTNRWKAVYANSYYLDTTAFGDIITHNASEYSLSSHTHTKSEITDFPTIPTVNNATLTIQKNSSKVATFTANASSNVTANITVPTKTSELTNDSGFLTSHQSLSGYLPLTGGVLTGGISRKHTGATKGTNPNSVCYWSVYNCDKDGTNYKNDCLGLFETSLDTAGVVSTYIRAMKNTANNNTNATIGVTYDTANSVGYGFAPTPAANDNTTKIATTAWVQTFCGTTKGYLTSHQSLSNYVTLDGDQTISGTKTFSNDQWLSSNSNIYWRLKNTSWEAGSAAPSSTIEIGGITYRDKNNANMAYIIGFDWPSGSSGLKLLWRNKFSSGARSTSGSNVDCTLILGVTSAGVQYFEGNGRWNNNVVPLTTDSKTLGTSSLYWKGAYVITQYMGGDIVFNGTYNLRSNVDNSYVRIQGGSGEGKGSRIILSGKTRSGLQGYAEIVATDGTNTNTFTVKPNGETLVNGNNLAATIIKGLSVNGKTITYTKIDGSTGTITTQDTVYTHPTSAGNKHIPSGGNSGQILKYSSSGTAVWADTDFARTMTEIASRTSVSNGTWTISCTEKQLMMIYVYVVGESTSTTHKVSITLSSGAHALVPNTANLVALSSTSSSIYNKYYCLLWASGASVKITIANVTALGSLQLYAYQ